MVMVSGGFQCVNHVAPSTTLEEGSIALDVLRHSLRHNAALTWRAQVHPSQARITRPPTGLEI